jgi:hypothetical protein
VSTLSSCGAASVELAQARKPGLGARWVFPLLPQQHADLQDVAEPLAAAGVAGQAGFIHLDQVVPALLGGVVLRQERERLGVGRRQRQDAAIETRRARPVVQAVAGDARRSHAGGHACRQRFAALEERLEHVGDGLVAAFAPMQELQDLRRAFVACVELERALQPPEHALLVDLRAREAQLHLGGAHRHRRAIQIVGGFLGLRQISVHELAPAVALAAAFVERERCLVILRRNPENALEQAACRRFFQQVLAQDLGLEAQPFELPLRTVRQRRLGPAQARHGAPLAPLQVLLACRCDEPE